MAPRSRPKTVAQSSKPLKVGREGASTAMAVGPLPTPRVAAGRGRERRYHLKLADIEGRANPGIVYGVYVHRPGEAEATSEQRRVGAVAFFGVEHSTKRGSKSPQPLSYTFDITDVIRQLGAQGDLDDLAVSLIPIEGMVEEPGAAASVPPPVNIRTVAVLTS